MSKRKGCGGGGDDGSSSSRHGKDTPECNGYGLDVTLLALSVRPIGCQMHNVIADLLRIWQAPSPDANPPWGWGTMRRHMLYDAWSRILHALCSEQSGGHLIFQAASHISPFSGAKSKLAVLFLFLNLGFCRSSIIWHPHPASFSPTVRSVAGQPSCPHLIPTHPVPANA